VEEVIGDTSALERAEPVEGKVEVPGVDGRDDNGGIQGVLVEHHIEGLHGLLKGAVGALTHKDLIVAELVRVGGLEEIVGRVEIPDLLGIHPLGLGELEVVVGAAARVAGPDVHVIKVNSEDDLGGVDGDRILSADKLRDEPIVPPDAPHKERGHDPGEAGPVQEVINAILSMNMPVLQNVLAEVGGPVRV